MVAARMAIMVNLVVRTEDTTLVIMGATLGMTSIAVLGVSRGQLLIDVKAGLTGMVMCEVEEIRIGNQVPAVWTLVRGETTQVNFEGC